jgi:Zn-dependent protease with chaperone function
LTVIATGTAYKVASLSAGGNAVARLLGGRPINTNTANLKQRQVLNVVEEMAIASGVPVPTVYLLEDEAGINAFAAGFSPTDAVVAVTQGTVDLLSRDELQGVIAHEFSHILNGDMRLNIRLMGVLHGILVIALIGYTILRGGRITTDRKGGSFPILLFALSLLAIGYVGVFFARLIKSAVSRQREFLADASAVQFTRNPGGIAGALKKIGGFAKGSKIKSPKAEEASHFYFALGLVTAFEFLSTHPPLDERIRRIDPSFDGKFPKIEYPVIEYVEGPPPPPTTPITDAKLSVLPKELTDLVGKLTQAHIAYAAALVSALPNRVVDQVHEPSGARAVIFALLLSPDSETRRAQFGILNESKDPLVTRNTLEVSSQIEKLPPQARLPLIDMALPALRRLSPEQHEAFRDLVRRLVMADEKCDLFEFTVLHILRRHLDRYFHNTPPPKVKYESLVPLTDECSVLLSGLAQTGHSDDELTARAFADGAEELGDIGKKLSLRTRKECSLTAIWEALEKLVEVTPKLKRQVLRACTAAVSHDQQVTIQEGELLRAIADTLDCPLPPFLTTPGFQFKQEETTGVNV